MVNKVYESKSFSTKIAGVLQWKESENVGTSGKKNATHKKQPKEPKPAPKKNRTKPILNKSFMWLIYYIWCIKLCVNS